MSQCLLSEVTAMIIKTILKKELSRSLVWHKNKDFKPICY